jgi:hypothetical protein
MAVFDRMCPVTVTTLAIFRPWPNLLSLERAFKVSAKVENIQSQDKHPIGNMPSQCTRLNI